MMNDINQRLAKLSPAKRALLEQKLKQKSLEKNRELSIPRSANSDSASLSFSQVRMWLLDQLEPGNPAYNRPTNIHLTGQLNVAALEQSLNEIVRRHDILRTSFLAVDGQPVQVISATLTLSLPIVDLSHLVKNDRESEVQRLATQEAQQSFNLSQLPLIKAILVRLNEQEHILLLTLHHIIFDGWSMGVLTQELAALYEAFSTGKPSPLPELPIQYADFAEWQRQKGLESQLAYWKKQLGGNLPVLELPTDQPRGAVQTFRGAKHSLLLSKTLTQALKELSQREGVTLFMTLLAAFQTLLYRYTGQDDIIVGTPIAGRDRTETEKLIGVFINTLVLRTQIDSNLTVRELLGRVREVALGAYNCSDIPFEKLVQELQPERNLSRTPLFQILFQLRNLPNEAVEVQGLKIEDCQLETGIVMLDLALEIEEQPEGLYCTFKYNKDLFNTATIEQISVNFQTLLAGIIANPEQSILDLTSLIISDRKALSNYQRFNCFLIGHESLLIPCAELLLKRGHQVLGIVSTGTLITSWATSQGIPCIQPTEDLVGFLSQQPFDYLFSIYNPFILPQKLLELPRQYAINCHDALLPKYGGLNAPSWAILHQEKNHGITWHKMTHQVDLGDILKQVTISISKKETAFTLNGKCYETIIHSFSELIYDLATNQVTLVQQDLAKRSYFLRSEKPSPGCILSWNRQADEIDTFIRALEFGSYENLIGLPKLVLGSEFFVVSKIEVLDTPSTLPPGTITAIESNCLQVSTASYDILLHQVLTIDGQLLSMPEFATRFKLQVGEQFKEIELDRSKRIKTLEVSLVKHENFWVERLATLQLITLPSTEQKISSQLSKGEVKSKEWLIPNQVITFLESYLPAETLGKFVIAAFAAYLARINQTECFDLGLRYSELQSQLIGLEGLFASAVPCRIEINQEQRFAEVVRAVNEQVELIKQQKTYSRDVVLRYPQLQSIEVGFDGKLPIIVEQVACLDDYKQKSPENSLILVISENEKKCYWVYDTASYADDSIDRILEQFTIFVQSIITAPNQDICNLQLLSDAERHQLLVEWNASQTDYLFDRCIHQLFEQQVDKTPDAIAVMFQDQKLTYRELNTKANQLAHKLQQLGVKPEVLVGICVERSLEMIVGLLGILKAGGAYVPLDPVYPMERLAYMVSDAQVQVLLTQEKLLPLFAQQIVQHIICLDTNWGIFDESEENIPDSIQPDCLAYMIYTSGSTGKPKGVLISHRSLINFTRAAISEYEISQSENPTGTLRDRILQFASISFDAAVEEIYPCLITGGTLVLRTDEMLSSPSTFLKACQDWKVTVLELPTAYWQQLVSELATTNLVLPKTLRLVIIGGERVLPESVRIWQQQVGDYPQLLNTYGPTEATVVATAYKVKASTPIQKEVPIGRALANVQTYILDRNLQPVPIGIPGELYLGGLGLARGYLNRPELTKEKFIANPFSNDPKARLYKTGDRVRYLPDGNIEFIGRIDNQVKIRGFRIELGEIEAVLIQHPTVKEAVVIAREDQPGNKRLVAYFISNSKESITNELRSFLKTKLPEYMVPSIFVRLDVLPLTLNGKVDRRALPIPEIEDTFSTNFVSPRNSTEEQLASIWSSVLGIERVGIHHNFFELGGHSLLATQVISRIGQAFQMELPLRALFEAPTVAQLGDRIDTILWTQSTQAPLNVTNLEEGEL
ncbi:amino acid adenylation domain-containing protein [Aerosakkonemataceae cyanobacterium BLCC-F154]|uniref:Amino acid adenylation domain-containing protein n=1 Tax=Floridaenema fluviatile BLCC-F154 TaxID=3153640 RepID=A0ABV4YFS7_9CYAN